MSNAPRHAKLQHALDLVLFEQWLRFYFIAEEQGKLFIRMPDYELEKARTIHPELAPVADALNNREVNHESALEALRDSMLGGPFALSGEQWAEILVGKDFRLTLDLLAVWVQEAKNSLDDDPALFPLSFAVWKKLFADWRESPDIKEYSARAGGGGPGPERVQ